MSSKERVTITLDKETLEYIDSVAKSLGWTRSRVIEYMVTKGTDIGKLISEQIEELSELKKRLEQKKRRKG